MQLISFHVFCDIFLFVLKINTSELAFIKKKSIYVILDTLQKKGLIIELAVRLTTYNRLL